MRTGPTKFVGAEAGLTAALVEALEGIAPSVLEALGDLRVMLVAIPAGQANSDGAPLGTGMGGKLVTTFAPTFEFGSIETSISPEF